MQRHAPDRAARRALWTPYSHATRPDLLPWDLGLDWSVPADQLGPQIRALHLTPHVDYSATPTRAQAFALMTLMGYTVIPHALGRDIPDAWTGDVVVYLSEYGGHGGEDKARMPARDARRDHPHALCSLYLTPDPDDLMPGQTWHERELVCGDFQMRARLGSHNWRSNDDGQSLIWADPEPRAQTRHATLDALCGPHYGVDLILSGGQWYALDFNLNPSVGGAPLHRLPGGSIERATDAWSAWPTLRAASRIPTLPGILPVESEPS